MSKITEPEKLKQGLSITQNQSAINSAIDHLGIHICSGEAKTFDKETVERLMIDKIIEKADVKEIENFLKKYPKFRDYIEYDLLQRCEKAFNPWDEETYDKYHNVFREIKIYCFQGEEKKWKDIFPDLEDMPKH